MREKKRDENRRWRNQTIAFRVSPEEKEEINMRARLCGLSKTDYAINRCMEKDVVVYGNPRVYKALKDEMEQIRQELSRLNVGTEINDTLRSRMEMVSIIYEEMKEER